MQDEGPACKEREMHAEASRKFLNFLEQQKGILTFFASSFRKQASIFVFSLMLVLPLLQIWPLATPKVVANSVAMGVANELRLATPLAT
jgi:hypothetical protein